MVNIRTSVLNDLRSQDDFWTTLQFQDCWDPWQRIVQIRDTAEKSTPKTNLQQFNEIVCSIQKYTEMQKYRHISSLTLIHFDEFEWMKHLHSVLQPVLQELVEDVAVATSSRHADLSWARRFAVASPRFIGHRSASTVLSQDCLGRPALRLQSPGESIMQASRARWWSCQGSARWRCPKNDRRRLRTVSDRSGCPVRQ